MKRNASIIFACLAVELCLAQLSMAATADYATQVNAVMQDSPPRITLQWPYIGSVTAYTVYRRLSGETVWNQILSLSGDVTGGVDTNVSVGVIYEYKVVKAGSITGYGYVCAGIEIPLMENRGKVILVADQTFSASLSKVNKHQPNRSTYHQ